MANEYLKRTFTSTGNLKTGTFSFWMKGRPYDTNQTRPIYLYDGSTLFQVLFERSSGTNPGQILVYTGSLDVRYKGVYRDPSAWSHYLIKVDNTTNGAEARFEVYVNGVKLEIVGSQTTSTASYPARDVNIFNNVYYINGTGTGAFQVCDYFFIDGQALTPDVFGFYKVGKGYISAGSTQSTDFRPGQWVPKTPRVIKTTINNNGGFGVNGFYLPMNDSKNFGADFHCDPNSIITLNEKLPQPRVGVATTASVGLGYTDALRADPYAANLVLALPFVSGGLNSGFGDYASSIKGSGSAKTITNNTTVSVANTHGYYGSSAYIDSVNYLSSSSADFAMGTGDFTIEGWINQTGGDTTNGGMFSTQLSNGTGIGIAVARDQVWLGNNSTSYGSISATLWPLNQWTHIAVTRSGTTMRVFTNGVCSGITTTATGNIDRQNAAIGRRYFDNSSYTPIGYLQDLRIYKGVAKYTGGFDVPRPYTPVGIATWRAVPDTTANNFATLNPLIEARPSSGTNSPSSSTIVTFAGGNLDLTNSASAGNAQRMYSFATIGISTGRWYWEVRAGSNDAVAITKGFQQLNYAGVLGSGSGLEASVAYYGGGSVSIANTAYYSTATTLTPPTFDTTNIIGIAVSANSGLNNLTVQWFKDGVGVSTLTGIGATSRVLEWFPSRIVSTSGSGGDTKYNFGQNPSFSGNTTAGTYTDSNNKGLFKYQPPSGFLALCEDNLPTPAISDPGKYFKTVLWTGDGNSGRSIVGVGFTPDLVWIKSRDSIAGNNILVDSVRGSMKTLFSEKTLAEYTDRGVYSFNADGFTTGPNNGDYSSSGANYVAWCWKAGAGTTSTNTNGSITSVVSVNQDAGFSIVSYTGNATASTVGHGLGKIPKFIITKSRTTADDWFIYHSSVGNGSYVLLDSTAASTVSSTIWNNTSPTSTTFALGTSGGANRLNDRLIAYCWAEIEGFSKAFSYIGNGSADGPMIYLGLKPALIIIKRTNDAGNWQIYDSSRMSTNPNNGVLFPNLTNVEGTGSAYDIDFLSNGFKLRSTDTDRNASGSTYVGFAWAESPFTTANSK